MSRTRGLVSELRTELGIQAPMAPAQPPLEPIQLPPAKVIARKPYKPERFARQAAEVTTALVGVGRVGTRYATSVVLQFQAELAVAHGAVGAVLPDGWAEEQGIAFVKSRVGDHREFLLRPDLGRRLCPDSAKAWAESCKKDVDVQPILADGLSAVACQGAGPELLAGFIAECQALGLTVGTPVVAQFARVWLEDEIGELARARVSCILLGERPGLGTGDGLSAYMVFKPEVGRNDGERNMISNIHARGMLPADAAQRLARLASGMLAQKTSGVDLDLAAIPGLGGAGGTALREPQVRKQLVEVP
ncbi:MAG: ethanolamine ammonia-lyase subunit EutC [Proteobacteria bacterium]|nr:ethanolamine ammonia-lyase subunit EutC [Pseudomonadota bacterium]MCP4919791.1 ethanolamine ammonia-lyase subunit EutC [Pseudomonadota bacterium]